MSLDIAKEILIRLESELGDSIVSARTHMAANNNSEALKLLKNTVASYHTQQEYAFRAYPVQEPSLIEQMKIIRPLYQQVKGLFYDLLSKDVDSTLEEQRRLITEEENRLKGQEDHSHENTEKNQRHNLAAAQFNAALDLFEKNVITLETQAQSAVKYREASDTARRLYNNLHKQGTDYFSQNRSEIEKQKFREYCGSNINDAKQVLEQHQEWGSILSNLLKAIANALIAFVTRSKYNFFPIAPTDAGLGAEILQVTLEHSLEDHPRKTI